MVTDLVAYDGPLGALAPELARRRIAVASDVAGRVCLVRPDSVVLEFAEDAFDDVRKVVADERLDVLGDPLGEQPPPSLTVAFRPPPERRRRVRPERWSTDDLRQLTDVVQSDRYEVRPNQVYLADGVARHFGRVGESGSAGTPGFTTPTALRSTVKPAGPPTRLPEPLALDPHRHRVPHVLVLDTGLRTLDAHA